MVTWHDHINFVHKAEPPNCVIPAWSAGIQTDMDVSGSILVNLDAGFIHAGMTEFAFSFCLGEPKFMEHFVR
jgi:hypothetical protein